ncbi:alanine racemase [Acidaminobacter hydrogenoformans]|uniref:Alanine racemase n=1 Tax=Acidaminobacter hydrogenoformans DSM 2784 TaxID=1120920 RepID=A0A1G5S4W2_9FIRM|nr:alanine racemase [Acidaminobacter hydrogenoformans]SCZ80791.1 alanine racemase [Acidaminobacter hydrogenoformans DSM 2784]
MVDTHQIPRPVWAEINLEHLAHNLREVRRLTKKEAMVMAVVKADAYGHGAVESSRTLLEAGADRLAVAVLNEALQLRQAFPETEIMVLGFTPAHLYDAVVTNGIIQTIYSLQHALPLSEAAVRHGREVRVHIKLDTGMHRIGMPANEATIKEILEIAKLPGLVIEGIFTHFAVADEVDKAYTMGQVEKYNFVVRGLEAGGLTIPIHHVSNSAAIIDLPELNFNMVRAGIMLYGLYPSPDVLKDRVVLKPVMSLKACLSHVKTLEAGSGISYGLKYITQGKEEIATMPLGYADGYTRMLSGKGEVLFKGARRPLTGRICMDQCMFDVSGLSAKPGDIAVLFGSDGDGNELPVENLADKLGTINYEIVCMIDKRVPRVYVKNGEITAVKDYVSMIR